ncbi:MAG TPA: hypothetical protein PKX37_10835, partial [Flexilinea sp.]|nr:hypothetical protein [Flexilinea sp.]
HRRSIRLNGSESSQTGSYFITICAQNRRSLFGEIMDGKMRLNELGRMIHFTGFHLLNHIKNIELILSAIMHIIHAEEFESVGAGSKPALVSLSEIVWQFKMFPATNAENPRLTTELL